MVLDIGCGGWCRGDVGLDVSLGQYGGSYKPWVLDKYVGGRNLEAQLIIHNLNEGIPFGGEVFSEVKAIHILEHLENPFFVLCEGYRVLESGGRLIWAFPNPLLSFLSDKLDPSHIYSWSPHSAKHILEKAGFGEIGIRYIHRYLDILITGVKQ